MGKVEDLNGRFVCATTDDDLGEKIALALTCHETYDSCMKYIDTYLPNDADLRNMADDDLVTVKITAERAREIRAAIAKARKAKP